MKRLWVGGVKKTSFLQCGPALKDFGGVFFLAIPKKQQSQQDVFGSVVLGLGPPPPLVI